MTGWRVLTCGALLIAWTSLASCGRGGSSPPSQGAPAPGPLKIGFLLDDIHERWDRDRGLFTDRAKALGAEVRVTVANGDQQRQLQQARSLLDWGARVLVVVPHDAEGAATLVEEAGAKKVPVISYDRLIRNAAVALYVTFDNVKVGEMQAQYLLNRAPTGKYILIGGAPSDNNAKQYREGQLKVLAPAVARGAVEIVADPWAQHWEADEAAALTAAALDAAHNRVAAIVASNDVTAGGVVRVLEERKLAGLVLVSGMDAELEAARRIVAGTQAMTVYKPLGALARLAARSAVQLARGERVNVDRRVPNGRLDVPTMMIDPITVDKSNLDAILISDGFHKREDVYRRP